MTNPDADLCTGDRATCAIVECMACSERDCPHSDPLHYHHDGCPSCEWEEPICERGAHAGARHAAADRRGDGDGDLMLTMRILSNKDDVA